jgi:hypothetical protein
MAAAGRSGAAADGSRNPPSWVAAAWTDSAARATGPPPPAGASSHSSTTSRPSTAVAASGLLLAVCERIVNERVRHDSGRHRESPGGDATVFYPVMRFVTAREQEVRFQVREGSQDSSRYGS